VQPASSAIDNQQDIPTLDPVTVVGQPEDALTVSNTLDRQTLEQLPAKNGSINEAISILPGIQFGEFYRTSDNPGEILPPSLSISGGRFYENNFTLDGISNNSLLDPANDDQVNYSDVPSHPQEMFIDPALVDSITVYRSNIPARFGSFTGGVVETETRDPGNTFNGQITLRHTRSEWTELHQSLDRLEEYENPVDGSTQPEFRKYDGRVTLDLPVNEHLGFLVSYSKIYSKIPLVPIDQTVDQERSLENYFLKGVLQLTPDTQLSLTGTSTPYEADLFLPKALNSNYTLRNSGHSLTTNLEHSMNSGNLEFNLSYRLSENSRQAPSDYYTWRASENKPWGFITDAGGSRQYSREGGYGDLDKEQKALSANAHMTLNPIEMAKHQHQINFGASFEQAYARFVRKQEMTNFTYSWLNDNVVCDDGAVDCIAGEQFMIYKTVYPADDTDARIRFYDAYVEDLLTFGKISFRPGIRVSYDDLQKNTNWAHRLAAGYDLFGDGGTMLFAGYNRYYGKTLLTHALNENRLPYQVERRSILLDTVTNEPLSWAIRPRTVIGAIRLADLDTPYSDEVTIGLDQNLFGGLLNLTYLEREGKDELALTVLEENPETDYKYSEWTNDGRSKHKEASLTWEKSWDNHYLLLAATWQETNTSNSDYGERADLPDNNDDGIADPVWYQGRIVDREDLPRPDFNRDFVGTLTYIGRLPHDLTFTNITRYRSGYDALANTGDDITLESGEKYDVFDEIERPESWIFDWRLDWQKMITSKHQLVVSL
ncbi:MAG: TonB-dependent receptor plug domain-containing protein, partial [Desulfuromonadales bacterium]|nr:TonB-dependent receptor plug domain-containing protein [Desulfuromonadales bacterium]